MTDRRSGPRRDSGTERCVCCGTPLSVDAADETASAEQSSSGSGPGCRRTANAESGRRYCSSGCRDVDRTLESSTSGGRGDRATETDTATDDGSTEPVDRTFFRVDGMHSATCESFLESVAEDRDGVVDAAASYVTESVRIEHDPERVSSRELRDALSILGYTAYLRSEATSDEQTGGREGGTDRRSRPAEAATESDTATETTTGSTRRSREMSGIRKRRSDTALEFRYVVGIVFGSFLLVPYLAVLYPVYLSSFVDWGPLHLYEDAFADFDGFLFLPVFLVVAGAVLYLTGRPLLRGAYVSLKLRRPNAHLLAALTIVAAYAYGTLAIALGRIELYYDLTIVVAALVMAAVFYEATVKRRARDRLTELTISQVDTARMFETRSGWDEETEPESGPSSGAGSGPNDRSEPDSEAGPHSSDRDSGPTRTVPVDDLTAGDRLLVLEGERIPVDGTLESDCTVDEAVVTGESLPIRKTAGDPVVGGSIVRSGAAVVDVGSETTSSIDRLTETVWNLQSATHGVQRRADAVAAVIAPLVLTVAVAVGTVAYLQSGTGIAAVTALLVTVVVASPWALGFAAPISVGAGLREALSHGIVVFDESVLERLREIDVVVFDKTGTLTTGEMTVLEAEGPSDLLAAVGDLERRAAHPVAAAITDAFGDDGGWDVSANEPRPDGDGGQAPASPGRIEEFDSLGTGVTGIVDGNRLLVGHPDLFRERGWSIADDLEKRLREERGFGRLPIAIGRDGRAEGYVVVGDEPRSDWDDALSRLGEGDGQRALEVVVLTGDDEEATAFFADHPAVDHAFAGVPPDGKTETIRRLQERGRVAMVGDGTNDAPALAVADLGISMGGATALAADAADLAIVEDSLPTVGDAFELAAAARRRVRGTIALAFAYNAIVLPAALAGVLNPFVTTAAVAATAAVVVGNAFRPLLE
ncbi:heavy metal translocating P-type ATPase [Halobiforma nitratireducens]|uniref:heavy metal translocating P-type ATPase n=1 Tax=Halobiforma nitratireducens TaxID=130048 RepID=UPI000677C878|nr:heavy metal translocating P-type ATPase [Halobiforma nitratireducens]